MIANASSLKILFRQQFNLPSNQIFFSLRLKQSSIPECSLKNVSVSATSIAEPDCHGYLWKQGNFHKSWRRRYCVLKYGCLFYYEEMADQCAIGVFKLHNYTISEFDLKDAGKHGIQAVPPGRKMRTYYFYAESEIDWKR